jgi:hypothetical protein
MYSLPFSYFIYLTLLGSIFSTSVFPQLSLFLSIPHCIFEPSLFHYQPIMLFLSFSLALVRFLFFLSLVPFHFFYQSLVPFLLFYCLKYLSSFSICL